MRKAGVLGWPVSHSLSPKLHSYWLRQYGINGSYEALPVKPEDLAHTLKSLPSSGFVGVNLTIPHKEACLASLDSIDDAAKAIGAVNTIVIEDGKLHGRNTDAYGFIENIRQNAQLPGKNKAVVLGAGGAARAVLKALLDEGFAQIHLANRTPEKAIGLAQEFGKSVLASPWEKRSGLLTNADLLVNTTSLGLKGGSELEIDLSALSPKAVVNDLVYVPLMTPLLTAAKARGNPVVDGLGMLMYQAVPAFEAWFGVRPEVTTELKKQLGGA